MIVTNVVKDSFIDYKDEHALVVFSKGCNLDCDICYNKNKPYDFEEDLLEIVQRNITPLHTAVVISGGEPTIQDLHKTCKDFKELFPELKLKVFTNGQNPDMVIDCLNFVDTWSIDFKTLQDTSILGVDCPCYKENVIRTLQILSTTKADCIVRIWKHPKTSLDDQDEMIRIIKEINPDTKFELVDILL